MLKKKATATETFLKGIKDDKAKYEVDATTQQKAALTAIDDNLKTVQDAKTFVRNLFSLIAIA